MILSNNAKRAVEKYGEARCLEAYRQNKVDGDGANTIGFGMGLTTRQADAAINAGRELLEIKSAQ